MMEYFVNTDNEIEVSKRILYTPSPFARKSLLYLQEIGSLSALKQHSSERNGLKSYLFFFVQEGNGELTYNDILYPLSRGSCVFIDCSVHYEHCTKNDLWTLSWIHFNGVILDQVYQKYVERGGNPVFYPKNITSFFVLWNALIDLAESSDYIRDMKINELLNRLLTLLMQETCTTPKDAEYMTNSGASLEQIRKHLDIHYKEELLLDDISKRFYISKYHLNRLFKKQYGITMHSYINKIRITHSKRLLRFSNKPIAIVAHECGIEDGNYFSRLFKRIEGVTPTEFRDMWFERVTSDD